jgi:hypothetical protein
VGKHGWHICPPPPHYAIRVRGRWIHFEDHGYCGPMPMSERTFNGIHLGHTHPFWNAVTEWYAAGKPVGEGTGVRIIDGGPTLPEPVPEMARGL